jgi:hypothetical protein
MFQETSRSIFVADASSKNKILRLKNSHTLNLCSHWNFQQRNNRHNRQKNHWMKIIKSRFINFHHCQFEDVERKHFTNDENRFIMFHASIWWWWSDDAVLRYKSYLRDDSMTNRIRDSFLHLMINFESSLIFMQWLRIEIIISIIISIIIRCLSVINKHEDEMTESTTSKQCDEDKIKSSCSKMSFDWWRSFWVDELITSNIWDDCLDWMKAKMTI